MSENQNYQENQNSNPNPYDQANPYQNNPYQKNPYESTGQAGQNVGQTGGYQQPHANPYQQPQQANPYGGQASQNQGQAYGQHQQQTPRKQEPMKLANFVNKLFTSQAENAFKINLDKISIILILILSIVLTALANAISRYYFYSYEWYAMPGFFVYSLVLLILFIKGTVLHGLLFGHGMLVQKDNRSSKEKINITLDALASASVLPLIFLFFSFIFSFFAGTLSNVLRSIALFTQITLFFDALEIKLGKKVNQVWYKVGLIAAVYLINIVVF